MIAIISGNPVLYCNECRLAIEVHSGSDGRYLLHPRAHCPYSEKKFKHPVVECEEMQLAHYTPVGDGLDG